MTNSCYKGLLCGIFLLLPGITSAQPSTSQVVIVKSSDNSYFNKSIETLIDNVDQATNFKVILARELDDSGALESDSTLFVTLGQSAAAAVSRPDSTSSSINAYLTREQFNRLIGEGRTGVLLDQPLRRYLAFCKNILAIDTVGVIESQKIILDKQQSRLLDALKLELNQYRVDPVNKLLPVLRQLLVQNDALLMLPRQSLYNRDTLKGVLLTSYRSRKPAISYSPAHVKSGALASIYSSPVDIGRHLALLVNQRLQDPAYKAPAFEYARFYSISTNRRVARALNISLPSASSLRSALERLEP